MNTRYILYLHFISHGRYNVQDEYINKKFSN